MEETPTWGGGGDPSLGRRSHSRDPVGVVVAAAAAALVAAAAAPPRAAGEGGGEAQGRR